MRSIRYHYLNQHPELINLKEKVMKPYPGQKQDPREAPSKKPEPNPSKIEKNKPADKQPKY